ncbi:hypothetical protein EUX98_g2474 [Antrodiella citrinella]|uniref:Uncharacterized protein n=1 Tax=Antrodiella citrinella TaxID=2447956 RepID=A0A4S4MYY5_9APHY|nr:hypothetical protein EUX98_g2474 [Antrodiella citrinella]
MHDNDPEVLEQEKQRNLRKEQHKTSAPIRNAPGWNQHLASASEANIKADRSDNHPSEMTEHTIKYLKERHTVESEQIPPASGVNEERLEASEASYERDEISGPLKGAKKTKTEVHSQTVEKDSVVGS